MANEDGQSWSAPLARLQAARVSEASTAQFSRLVTIGVAETGRVLVDFARARGVISLDGPTRARHEVLRRWLGELTGNPWSNDPRVVMVGNGLPQPEQVEHLAAIEQVIPELDATGGGVLVLSQAPSVAQQDLLAARFADPGFALGGHRARRVDVGEVADHRRRRRLAAQRLPARRPLHGTDGGATGR